MPLSLKKKKRVESAPNIPTASMGDIAFLIIIFFMATSILAKEKGLKVALPQKGAQVKIKAENVLQVSVNDRGQVLLGEDIVPVDLEGVNSLVADRLRANPELAVALRVSRKAPYQIMIETFDELRQAFKEANVGEERISLVPVQSEEPGAPQ